MHGAEWEGRVTEQGGVSSCRKMLGWGCGGGGATRGGRGCHTL